MYEGVKGFRGFISRLVKLSFCRSLDLMCFQYTLDVYAHVIDCMGRSLKRLKARNMNNLSFVPHFALQRKRADLLFAMKRCRRTSMHQSRLYARLGTLASVDNEERTESVLQQMRHSGSFIREAWVEAIRKTGMRTVIDATAGRGSDTISLGQYVGKGGIVHAFDIQQDAIEETRQRYEEASRHEEMGILYSHERSHEDFSMLRLKEDSVACVVYNLGWYPGRGADRSIITRESSTIRSLTSAEGLVAVGGVISIMAYVGHKWGKEEEEACLKWAAALCSRKWNVVVIKYPNRRAAPSLILCERSN